MYVGAHDLLIIINTNMYDKHGPEEESRPSSCSHGVDVQLWCLQGDSSCGRLKHMFILTSVSTHICRGSCSVRKQRASQEYDTIKKCIQVTSVMARSSFHCLCAKRFSIPSTHRPCRSQSQAFSPSGCKKWWRIPPPPLLGPTERPANHRTDPWGSDLHLTAWTTRPRPEVRGTWRYQFRRNGIWSLRSQQKRCWCEGRTFRPPLKPEVKPFKYWRILGVR